MTRTAVLPLFGEDVIGRDYHLHLPTSLTTQANLGTVRTHQNKVNGRTPRLGKGADVQPRALAHVLEWLGREQACYTALIDLSRIQLRLIESSDFKRLRLLMLRKQELLDMLDDIELCLKPTKKRWGEFRRRLSEDDIHVLDASLATVEELLSELIATERRSERLLHSTAA
jgi:hypothetical protein